jgi:hypothetical protein
MTTEHGYTYVQTKCLFLVCVLSSASTTNFTAAAIPTEFVSNYLDQFPQEHRQFVHNRFSQAYVFEDQRFEFGEDDCIDLAPGPRTVKERVIRACEEMRPFLDEERQQVLDQVVATVDSSDDFSRSVKEQVDRVWEEAHAYARANPKKDRKKPEPVTDPQKNFLRNLGCTEVPKTKAEASRLIERYKKKK